MSPPRAAADFPVIVRAWRSFGERAQVPDERRNHSATHPRPCHRAARSG
jgi:hypothetical protein